MQSFEYLAVAAPIKGQKVKGLKTPAERYAHQLTVLLNDAAAEGWEYWRADTLISEERKGLTGTTRLTHDLLIFRRPTADALAAQMSTQGNLAGQPHPAPVHERAEPQLGRPEAYGDETGPRLTAHGRD